MYNCLVVKLRQPIEFKAVAMRDGWDYEKAREELARLGIFKVNENGGMYLP